MIAFSSRFFLLLFDASCCIGSKRAAFADPNECLPATSLHSLHPLENLGPR